MTLPAPWAHRLSEAARRRGELGRDRRILPPAGVDFTSNDYLGLRRDPRLIRAAQEAAQTHGAGTGAARLLRGTTPVHEALESALADWKGLEAALLFNTGYQANATVIPALAGTGDAVFSDALNHASLVDGCRLAKARGAEVQVYAHLDLAELDRRLDAWRRGAAPGALALVATDAVFSMDGDAADLPGLLDICTRHQALLLVDEAHSSGLLGPEGGGLAAHQGVHGQVPLVMGTLGKALGSAGAFIAGSTLLRDHLLNSARGFIFSTALPAASAGAALAGLAAARTEPGRAERALGLARRLRAALGQPDRPSAIVPVPVGPDAAAVARAAALQARGFDVRAVRPPTVPEGTARLRITTGAHLQDAELEALIHALQELP